MFIFNSLQSLHTINSLCEIAGAHVCTLILSTNGGILSLLSPCFLKVVYVGAIVYSRTVLLFMNAQYFFVWVGYNFKCFIVRQLDRFQSFDTKNNVSSEYYFTVIFTHVWGHI